jgi:hypothetical protein
MVEKTLNFKFDHKLSMIEQTSSEENDYYQKSIEVLTGRGKRLESDILIIDNCM